MSRSASGALLAWTDKGGLSGSEKADMVRIALRLAGYEPRLAAGAKLSGGGHAALMEALLPEELRPGKRDCRLSLERCVSVMLGGGVPEDRVLTAVVNKTNAAGKFTQNAWQVRCAAGAHAPRGVPRARRQTPWRQNPVSGARGFLQERPCARAHAPPRRRDAPIRRRSTWTAGR